MIWSLGGDTEEARDELRLPHRVPALQPFNLPLPHHVRGLSTFYRPLGRVERAETLHRDVSDKIVL
jgi:hypothetical protein